MTLTPEEIDAIKYAVKPFTPEERDKLRAERDAIASGEPVEVAAEVKEPTAGIPQDALDTKARQGIASEQIEEVKASLPAKEPKPRVTRAGRRRVSEL